MHRFFVDDSQIYEDYIRIIGGDVNHIKNVLRLSENEKIEISNKDGKCFVAKISSIQSDAIIATILEQRQGLNEPDTKVVLFQGLPKASKMDFIIQKTVEIGIYEIYPVITDRTIVKIKDVKKVNKKIERWNKIALEAAKQCKRDIVPKINNVINFDKMLDMLSNEKNIIVPYEDEKSLSVKEILRDCNRNTINLIIGPEGGFETEEIRRLKNIDASIVTLGPRILRSETAGMVALSIILYEFGDL